MRIGDMARLAIGSLWSQRLRSFLTVLGIGVGIAAVVLLTSIGEGVHRFTLAEFTQFGTNLIGINPGRTTTFGTSGALINTVRPLTMADEAALRTLPGVVATVPVVQGNGQVEYARRSRRTMILGIGPEVPRVWQMKVVRGRFLPADDSSAPRSYVVLGSKVAGELFGDLSPLGQPMRIAGERYRVIGVMERKGQMLGFDLDDAVYIPVQRAMSLFNQQALMEIDLLYRAGLQSATVAERVKRLLVSRHGREDFTITTQEEMLKVLGSVLDILTAAVAGLGAISLLVGGVGIVTIMTIAISERTAEIGLLRAIGADYYQILLLFIGEAVLLAAIGGVSGLAAGTTIAWLLGVLVPNLPTHTPWLYALYAELLAMVIGLLAGVLPARRAARLDPVASLRSE